MSEIGNVLTTAISLIWLSFLLFYGFRNSRLDAFRQDLFDLRDSLFQYAAEGNVAFDQPAYRELRNMINGLIRYAHKMSFIFFLLVLVDIRVNGSRYSSCASRRWEAEVAKLPPHSRKRLKRYHEQVGHTCLTYITSGSPLYCLLWSYRRIGDMQSSLRNRFHVAYRPQLYQGIAALEERAFELNPAACSEQI